MARVYREKQDRTCKLTLNNSKTIKVARRRVTGILRANTYTAMDAAGERGILYGWRRAHKHTDTPGAEAIQGDLQQAIMAEICEWFVFDDVGGTNE